MGWNTFAKTGSASTPQVDDVETMTVIETGQGFLTLPYDITLQDIVLATSPVQNHQFSIWVNGKKMSANLYAKQLDPAVQTRFNIAAQNIVIRAGSQIQIKTAQKSGAAAEALNLTLVYLP